MMKPQVVARWDPNSRAGAVSVTRKNAVDAMALSDTADLVMDWAKYQNLGGALDNVETSKVQGTYDWRSYLQEEADAAKEREAERQRLREKKQPPARPAPAPAQLYA